MTRLEEWAISLTCQQYMAEVWATSGCRGRDIILRRSKRVVYAQSDGPGFNTAKIQLCQQAGREEYQYLRTLVGQHRLRQTHFLTTQLPFKIPIWSRMYLRVFATSPRQGLQSFVLTYHVTRHT